MVTGASTADLAILLVDARKGVLTQTRRHSYLAKLVGIRRLVLAVNKMDLVDYDQGAFDAITADYRAFAGNIGIEDWVAIPVSGLNGDNVMSRSDAMPWFTGPSLLEHLDTVPLDAIVGRRQAAANAGAMGQSSQPELPRLLRPDRVGNHGTWRRGADPALRQGHPDRPDRDLPVPATPQAASMGMATWMRRPPVNR